MAEEMPRIQGVQIDVDSWNAAIEHLAWIFDDGEDGKMSREEIAMVIRSQSLSSDGPLTAQKS